MEKIALCLFFVATASVAAERNACAIAGTRTHWAADYCMAKLETDDEIAAGECLGEEHKRRFASECEAKRHYKGEMCRLATERGQRHDDAAACLADPAFEGSTVRNNGVGGRVQ